MLTKGRNKNELRENFQIYDNFVPRFFIFLFSFSIGLLPMKHRVLRGWHPERGAERKCEFGMTYASGLVFVFHLHH